MRHPRMTGVLLLFVATTFDAESAEFATANFVVVAQKADVARQVGLRAEYFRRSKAIEWLGTEIPTWGQPCTVQVRLTQGGAGGATSFAFDNGQILSQRMTVEGSLERILNSVLPHEITHTVFAAKFRRPLPRWADEGGAVLSEDYQELARHDLLVRNLINNGRMIPLNRLFVLTEYPRDVMALYAQGFSVANFLVSMRGRQYFLEFVKEGQQGSWGPAVNRFYGFRSVQDLEDQWIKWLIAGRGTGADRPPVEMARNETTPMRVVRAQIPDEPPQQQSEPAVNATAVAKEPSRGWPPVATRPTSDSASDPLTASGTGQIDSEPLAPSAVPLSIRPVNSAASSGQRVIAAATPAADGRVELVENDERVRPIRRIPIAVGRTRRSHHDE